MPPIAWRGILIPAQPLGRLEPAAVDEAAFPGTLIIVTIAEHRRHLGPVFVEIFGEQRDDLVAHQVADVQRWIDERKQLLRRAREIMTAYDGTPASLYRHHGTLVGIASRLAEIKQIFDTFRDQRTRHADANIDALVRFFSDPTTLEGVDD